MAIQSSGFGNSINVLMSLHRTYHLPPNSSDLEGSLQREDPS
jgi:hypothetical protein